MSHLSSLIVFISIKGFVKCGNALIAASSTGWEKRNSDDCFN